MPFNKPRIPAVMTPKSLNVFHQDKMWAVPSSHVNFSKIRDLLEKIETMNQTDEEKFWTLGGIFAGKETRIKKAISKLNLYLDVPAYLSVVTEGLVTVTEQGVLYDGEIVHNELTKRIISHLKAQIDILPLVKFLNRVKANPKEDIGEELFQWMEAAKLPVTEEGFLIAYKRVNDDYASFHRAPGGQVVMNTPGTVVTMERELVDHNRAVTCSSGLHFCGFDYMGSAYGSRGRTIVVEIDPADVCAIPNDYNFQKGRGCRYKVIGQLGAGEAECFFRDTLVVTGGTLEGGKYTVPVTNYVDIRTAWADEDEDGYDYEDDFAEEDASTCDNANDPSSPHPDDLWWWSEDYRGIGDHPNATVGEPTSNEVQDMLDRLDVENTDTNRKAFERMLEEFREERAKPVMKPYGPGYPYE